MRIRISNAVIIRSRAKTANRRLFSGDSGGGIGLHNVKDRVLVTQRHPGRKLYQHTAEPRTVTVIGAPMTYGQPYVGTDIGPRLLRQSGLLKHLSDLSWRVEDLPDLQFNNNNNNSSESTSSSAPPASASFTGNAKNSQQVGAGSHQVAQLVSQKLSEGRFPLILGGDHSIGIGSLAGLLQQHPETGVLWIDAHADLNTPRISESGNMHGMPVGLMMEGGLQNKEVIPGFEWLMHQDGGGDFSNRLKPSQIVYVGLRDVDQAERKLIQQLGIAAYTMTEIDRYGIGKVMDLALQHLLQHDPNRRLHLSYDIDAVDPVHAPATGTAVRGGLTFREAHYVAEAVAESGNLASAEIVELNPTLSHEKGADDTVELGLQLITSLMGKSII